MHRRDTHEGKEGRGLPPRPAGDGPLRPNRLCPPQPPNSTTAMRGLNAGHGSRSCSGRVATFPAEPFTNCDSHRLYFLPCSWARASSVCLMQRLRATYASNGKSNRGIHHHLIIIDSLFVSLSLVRTYKYANVNRKSDAQLTYLLITAMQGLNLLEPT